ncbi:hypothetical protein H6G97_35915 [Nostoc flagelliforme FACHB-838]|uniref:Uncharacterized protein n=1 Tax=Nostoc flagelliforme FACHB-838 TaxID=2692904 RepID=A0ABR8DZ08_9NOSO|nr:hypothetical protein [Nostoc flagelliforme FACHB-838]
MKYQCQKLLLYLLFSSIVITSFHYADNGIFIDKYPSPEWINNANLVYIAWIVLTLIGIVGYFLYKRGMFRFAYLCLGIYSFTGLSSPGHYFYGEMSKFSLRMHTLILFDFFAGLLIFGFILWSLFIKTDWRNSIDLD